MEEGARIELGGGLDVRGWRAGDERALVRHGNDRAVSWFLRERFPFPYTDEHARGWVDFHDGAKPVTQFAIELDGEVIGGAGLELGEEELRFGAELGYWLGRAYWGRGLATRVVNGLLRYAFARLRLVRLHAGVLEGNVASARVLEKCGFSQEGVARRAVYKHGRLWDQWNYALVREGADPLGIG
jgi:ribosomal-protein-alanine N-acetyltransferase